MGAITNIAQHQKDVQELKEMAETMSVIKRHCSHHFGNSFASLICDIELLDRDISEGKISEGTKGCAHRIRMAIDHFASDLADIGFIHKS